MNKKLFVALATCTTLSAFAMEREQVQHNGINVSIGTNRVIVNFPILKRRNGTDRQITTVNTASLTQHGIQVAEAGRKHEIGPIYLAIVAHEALDPTIMPELKSEIRDKKAVFEGATIGAVCFIRDALDKYFDSEAGKKAEASSGEQVLVRNSFFMLTLNGKRSMFSFERDKIPVGLDFTPACSALLEKLKEERDNGTVTSVDTDLEIKTLKAAVHLDRKLQPSGTQWN